jgi:hypothetical protein
MKTLTNSEDIIGRRIRISNSGGTSKRIGNLNSSFEKADSLGFEKVILKPASNFFLNFSISSPAYGTIYRITGGFLNAATSSLKRDSLRIFELSKSFHRSKPKLEFPFSP